MNDNEPEEPSAEVYLPARLPNGHFQRGHSGNPSGRPKLAKEVKDMLAGLTPLAVQALAEGLQSEDERVRLVAAQQILDRVLGKPAAAEKEEKGANNSQSHIEALAALAAQLSPQVTQSSQVLVPTADDEEGDEI